MIIKFVIKSMRNMIVAMATIIQAVCRSDNDLSDDINNVLKKMSLAIHGMGVVLTLIF